MEIIARLHKMHDAELADASARASANVEHLASVFRQTADLLGKKAANAMSLRRVWDGAGLERDMDNMNKRMDEYLERWGSAE